MTSYYVYGSTNRAYYSLINNAVLSSSLTKEDFDDRTISYKANDYLFASKKLFSKEEISIGVPDGYYPVTFEVCFDDNDIVPVKVLTQNEFGEYIVSEERRDVLDIENQEDVLGVFICGQIPFARIKNIILEDDVVKQNFRKSSPDLWFPEAITTYVDAGIQTAESNILNMEQFESVCSKMNEVSTDSINVVKKQLKHKAAAYYAIDGTAGWSSQNLRTNLDITLINLLAGDNESELKNRYKVAIEEKDVAEEKTLFNIFCGKEDSILLSLSNDINSVIFRMIAGIIVENDELKTEDVLTVFKEVVEKDDTISAESKTEIKKAIGIIETFRNSTFGDPIRTAKDLADYPVLQALLFFLEKSNNPEFLKNMCTKLDQEPRRYAYIFFGLYNGMKSVAGKEKSNEDFERLLETKYTNLFKTDELISLASAVDSVGIIDPVVSIWYDQALSNKMITESADAEMLSRLYKASGTISEKLEIKSFAEPVSIIVKIGDKEHSFEATNQAEVKQIIKLIETVTKKEKEVFNPEMYRKALKDSTVFGKIFKKCEKLIQEICGEIK